MRKDRDELVHIGRAFRSRPVEAFLATPKAREAMAGAPLVAKRYATAVVEIANHEVIPGRVVADLPHGIEAAFSPLGPQRRRVAPELRQRLTDALDAIVTDPTKAVAAFAPRLSELSAELVAIPRFRIEHGELRIELALLPSRPEAVFDYGLALIMEGLPDLGKLCRCACLTCRKFYFAPKPKTGRPRTVFCSKACLDTARKADGARRIQEWRDRRRSATTKSQRKSK